MRPSPLFVIATLSVLSCRREAAHGAPAAAPAAPIQAAPVQAATPPHAPGQQDYVRLCVPCHGADLHGYAADHAPSLVSPTFLETASAEFLRLSIAGGRPGTSMGAYGKAFGGPLDDASLDRLVAFLRQKAPAPKILKAPTAGDVIRGGVMYAQACQSCHGTPQTRGEAVHLANGAFLRQASDAFIHHAVVNGRPGTKMLAFGTTLKPEQINDVVTFVRSFEKSPNVVDLLPPPTGKEPLVLNPKGAAPKFTKVRDNRFVGVDEVLSALAAHRKMIIIDARPPSEWMRVHVAGAVSIPYHDLKRLEEIPDDVWAIAYCACPHHLSGDVVDALIKRGHKKALVLDEGINEWHRRGYPVTAAKGVQVPAKENLPPPPGPLLPGPPFPMIRPDAPTKAGPPTMAPPPRP